MPTNEQAASKALPPQVQLIQMASAHWVSRLLYYRSSLRPLSQKVRQFHFSRRAEQKSSLENLQGLPVRIMRRGQR
jgi:hypothetical protein